MSNQEIIYQLKSLRESSENFARSELSDLIWARNIEALTQAIDIIKNNDVAELTKRISDHYGYKIQTDKCLEELKELTKAIKRLKRLDKKLKRFNKNKPRFTRRVEKVIENFYEEIADVSNMLDHMIYIYNCKDKVMEIKKQKLEREINRIKGEQHG